MSGRVFLGISQAVSLHGGEVVEKALEVVLPAAYDGRPRMIKDAGII